jgi:hypothetical protein
VSDPPGTLLRMETSQGSETTGPAQVILHPAVVALAARLAELKSNLAVLVEAVERSILVDGPWVLAQYDQKLGGLECELMRLRADNAARKRRLELIVAAQNRGEALTELRLEEIDARVKTDLAKWWSELEQREREVRRRCAWVEGGVPIDPAVLAEVRTIYRALCRQLHPDATGGESDAFARHWTGIQHAYRDRDVEVLRALHAILVTAPVDELADPKGLQGKCEELEARIRAQADKLAKVQTTPPLSHRAALDNPSWVEGKRKELLVAIEAEQQRRDTLEQTLSQVSGGRPWARA